MIAWLMVLVLLVLIVAVFDLWLSFRVKKKISGQYFNYHGEHHWLCQEMERLREEEERRFIQLDALIKRLEEIALALTEKSK